MKCCNNIFFLIRKLGERGERGGGMSGEQDYNKEIRFSKSKQNHLYLFDITTSQNKLKSKYLHTKHKNFINFNNTENEMK